MTIIRLWPFAVLISFLLVLMSVIAFGFTVSGEEICLDRHPWWGPPNDPNVYKSCPGHIYERLHKQG